MIIICFCSILYVAGIADSNLSALPPIPVSKEAKVQSEDIGDDRLGDEEWSVISTARDRSASTPRSVSHSPRSTDVNCEESV